MTKMIFGRVKIQCGVIEDMKCREAGYKVFRQSDAMRGLLTALPLYFRKDTSSTFQSVNGSPQAEQPPLESTSKEAFFSRVETFSISFFSSCHPNLMFLRLYYTSCLFLDFPLYIRYLLLQLLLNLKLSHLKTRIIYLTVPVDLESSYNLTEFSASGSLTGCK